MTADSPNSIDKISTKTQKRYELRRIPEQYMNLYRILDRETGQVRYMEIPFYMPNLQRYIDLGALLSEQSETVRIFALTRKARLIDSGSESCPDLFKLQTIISLESPQLQSPIQTSQVYQAYHTQKTQDSFKAVPSPCQMAYVR